MLWEEYCSQCQSEGTVPYMYTQYCEKYRQWARVTKAPMRIHHKPRDTMEVDWAGATLDIHGPVTGEVSKAYLFGAVLPCSCFTYAEACDDMKLESWINCHVHAYNYFGDVTRLKDNSRAEGGVKFTSTWILVSLKDRKLFTLEEAQSAVAEKLEELNDRNFKKRPGSRRDVYLEEEKDFMRPLPREPYEPAI